MFISSIQAPSANCSCNSGAKRVQKNVNNIDQAYAVCNILCMQNNGVERAELR